MRLINADELIKAIPKAEPDMFQNCRNCGCLSGSEIKEIINNTPTISPKKGYWRNYKDEHTCSICNEVTIQDPSAWIVDAYLYCPWCGAELSNMEVDANGE